MSTNQMSPDQTGTWEMDVVALSSAARSKMHNPVAMGGLRSEQVANAVIAAYRSQQAERGIVEVRREALRECYHLLRGTDGGGIPELRQELAEAIERGLAAAQDQTR